MVGVLQHHVTIRAGEAKGIDRDLPRARRRPGHGFQWELQLPFVDGDLGIYLLEVGVGGITPDSRYRDGLDDRAARPEAPSVWTYSGLCGFYHQRRLSIGRLEQDGDGAGFNGVPGSRAGGVRFYVGGLIKFRSPRA